MLTRADIDVMAPSHLQPCKHAASRVQDTLNTCCDQSGLPSRPWHDFSLLTDISHRGHECIEFLKEIREQREH